MLIVALLPCSAMLQATEHSLIKGAGQFSMAGGAHREALSLTVYYNIPKYFTRTSPILIVLPGSRRDAQNYRDYWLQASEQYNIMVLSPEYSKASYPKSVNYNLARMLSKQHGQLQVNKNPQDWLFSDLDRLFDSVVKQTGSEQQGYDLFGHSAGGQLSHRLLLFSQQHKARRVVVANAGWYTATDFTAPFPYGLGDGPYDQLTMKTALQRAFNKPLTIMLGAQDINSSGAIRRNKQADKQGISRVERGHYFYATAEQFALEHKYNFNWQLKSVANVGHSGEKMSTAAAQYLYGSE